MRSFLWFFWLSQRLRRWIEYVIKFYYFCTMNKKNVYKIAIRTILWQKWNLITNNLVFIKDITDLFFKPKSGLSFARPPADEASAAPSVRLAHNTSGRFESRWSRVLVEESKAVLLQGMGGAKMGVWVAHGEGEIFYWDFHVQRKVAGEWNRYVYIFCLC